MCQRTHARTDIWQKRAAVVKLAPDSEILKGQRLLAFKRTIPILLLLTLVASACYWQPVPAPTTHPVVEATPTVAAPAATAVPTSQPDFGTITGALNRENKPDISITNADLFLAEILRGGGNTLSVAALDMNAAPKAKTGADGHFAFVDVTPGTYTLVIRTPLGAMLIPDPDSGHDLLITVKADKTVDLGQLYVALPY